MNTVKSFILVSFSIFFYSILFAEEFNLSLIWEQPFDNKVDEIWEINNNHFLLRSGNSFYLLQKSDGTLIWEDKFQNIIFAFPVKEKNILIIAEDFKFSIVYLFKNKKVEIPAQLHSPNNLSYIDSLDILLLNLGVTYIALDPKNGKLIWRIVNKYSMETLLNYQIDQETETMLLFGIDQNKLILTAVNTSNGKLKWGVKLKNRVLDPNVAQYTVPIVKGDYIYIEIGGLSKIDYKTGKYVWYTEYDTLYKRGSKAIYYVILNSSARPIITDTYIYTAAKGTIRFIDQNTGKILWAGGDFDIVPTLLVRGDTLFSITGGTFLRVNYGPNIISLLFEVATAMYFSMTTNWLPDVNIYTEVKGKTILKPKEFENVKIKDVEKSIVQRGKPGIISLNKIKVMPLLQFIGQEDYSGMVLKYPKAIIADKKNIYRLNLATWKVDTLLHVNDMTEKGQFAHLLESNDELVLIITLKNNKKIRYGYEILKMDKGLQEVQWRSFIETASMYMKDYPILLSHEQGHLYLICGHKLVSFDIGNGKIKWTHTLPEDRWNFYLIDQSLIYCKDSKILFYKLML